MKNSKPRQRRRKVRHDPNRPLETLDQFIAESIPPNTEDDSSHQKEKPEAIAK